MKADRVIGIDPDVDKSGVCELYVKDRLINITSLEFPLLVDFLRYVKKEFADKGERVVVAVEAGYLNKSNWHLSHTKSLSMAARIGHDAGRNHETARKIVEMARHIGLETEEVKPLKKCWKGPEGKITHEELSYIVGGLDQKRTNQDARDATLIAWNYANLPIRINSKMYQDGNQLQVLSKKGRM